jgi:hypothetical protein
MITATSRYKQNGTKTGERGETSILPISGLRPEPLHFPIASLVNYH